MNFKKVTGRISSLYPVLAYDEDRQVFYLNASSQTSLGIGMTSGFSGECRTAVQSAGLSGHRGFYP